MPFSGQAIAALSMHQNELGIQGAVAEIGVHHGKLFFVLYLTTKPDESALAIDVFGAQHLNIDKSGCGNKAVFLKHASRWSPGLDGLKIVEGSSLDLSPAQVLGAVGRVRLFSIDGSHTEVATTNDLRLADAVLTDDGVVIVDDCFNEFWPEVSTALFKFLMSGDSTLTPFAITPGKILLARQAAVARYSEWIASAFPQRVNKSSMVFGRPVKVVGIAPFGWMNRFARTPIGKRVRDILRPYGRGRG